MNTRSITFSGFVGTLVLTTIMAASQGFGFTRMSLPFLLGSIFTPNRDRAKLIGFFLHLGVGWLLALVYAAAFENWRRADWIVGAAIGLVHALFVLAAGLPLLPAIHPRLANEEYGPTPTRQLEPPGFLALNYGRQTPRTVIFAHLIYGAILGALYRPNRA